MKLLNAFILTIVLVLLSPVAFAGDITYEGLAEDLVFLPDNDLIPMSLFYGCEALPPGEALTDRVRLSGSLDTDREIIIYMRADNLSCSGLNLEVRGMSNRLVFYGAPEEDGWIYLGSYQNGEGETLTLRLTAGEAPGNPQWLQWRFLAVERPPEINTVSRDIPPATADTFALSAWILMSIFSGTSLAVLACYAILPKLKRRNCSI